MLFLPSIVLLVATITTKVGVTVFANRSLVKTNGKEFLRSLTIAEATLEDFGGNDLVGHCISYLRSLLPYSFSDTGLFI